MLGANGSGSRASCGCSPAGGADPDVEHRPVEVAGDPFVLARPGWGRGCGGLVRADPRAPRADGPHAAGDPAPRRRPPRRDAARAGLAGAGHAARARRRAAVRVALRGTAGASSRSCCSSCPGRPCCSRTASRPTTSTWSPPRRWRRGWRRSRHGGRGDPRPLVRPPGSTGSWCTAPTGRSTSPTVRCGTRTGAAGPLTSGAHSSRTRSRSQPDSTSSRSRGPNQTTRSSQGRS